MNLIRNPYLPLAKLVAAGMCDACGVCAVCLLQKVLVLAGVGLAMLREGRERQKSEHSTRAHTYTRVQTHTHEYIHTYLPDWITGRVYTNDITIITIITIILLTCLNFECVARCSAWSPLPFACSSSRYWWQIYRLSYSNDITCTTQLWMRG